MTKDLAICVYGNKVEEHTHYVQTELFMDRIDEKFQIAWRKVVGWSNKFDYAQFYLNY